MRTWKLPLLTAIVALSVPATASAAFEHTILPGESLSSVAAADGLSVDQLAAANGLSADTDLTAGATLAIPPQDGSATPTSYVPATSTPSSEPVPTTSGSEYVVAPGDTLSAIAAHFGVSVDQLATANGLDPSGLLLAGATLSVVGGPSVSAAVVPTTTAMPSSRSGAQPTNETVSPSDVGAIAAQNGVSPSLAEAIAEQESGFNNDEVSSTGAIGVMQIEPGTWSDLSTLGGPLSPVSASDNVRGGVELLHSLLDQTGGDPALAAAAYYQGLSSVRAHGLYSDTQAYVNNVLALQQQFGG